MVRRLVKERFGWLCLQRTNWADTMLRISPNLVVGESVARAEMGVGVFVGLVAEGYARVFFQGHGERQVPLTALVQERSWEEQVVANVQPATPEALLRLWLAVEAEEWPH